MQLYCSHLLSDVSDFLIDLLDSCIGKSVFVASLPAVKSKVTAPPPNSEEEGFTVLLPCTVSNPNTKLSLYKLDKVRSNNLFFLSDAMSLKVTPKLSF
jgi:hypothetical protein